MEIRQLRYFIAVVQSGSFTAAAERIGVAQPALSAQIAKLESELGCPLLERHPRGVVPTQAGRRFHRHAAEILDRVAVAQYETSQVSRTERVEVKVGLPPFSAMLLTVPLVHAVRSRIPQATVRIIEGMGNLLLDLLEAGKIDLAILYSHLVEGFRDPVFLFEEDLTIVYHPGLNLGIGPEIGVRELHGLPLILSSFGNSNRRLLENATRRQGFALNVVAEIDSIPGQHDLVRAGVGAAVMPLSAIAGWGADTHKTARLRGDDLVSRAYLVEQPMRKASPEVKAVGALIVTLVQEMIRDGTWVGARPAQV